LRAAGSPRKNKGIRDFVLQQRAAVTNDRFAVGEPDEGGSLAE